MSEVLRAFAWFIILALKGPLNWPRLGSGIIDEPIRWITGFSGVIIGLVYTYVLFMLLPIYNAIQSLDTNQIEAAEDLGAPWWRTHWRVILPHAKPGIASGCGHGVHAVGGLDPGADAARLDHSRAGSPRSSSNGCSKAQDWNTGSAYAFLLLILCTVFVSVVMRVFRVKLSDIAK